MAPRLVYCRKYRRLLTKHHSIRSQQTRYKSKSKGIGNQRIAGVVLLGVLLLLLLCAVLLLVYLHRKKRAMQAKTRTPQIGKPVPMQDESMQRLV